MVVLRVWVTPMSVPLHYSGDSNLVMNAVKQITEGGWYYENPRVGMPFGLAQYDFPDGGQVQFAAFKVTGWLTGGDAAATFNVTFLAGYFAVAAVGYWVLRQLGIIRPWAVSFSILYAHLPYHLMRLGHHYLALYVAAPLAILLVVRQAQAAPAFMDDERRFRFRWRHPGTRAALICGLVIGMTGAYYAVFAGLIMATTGILVFLADRDWRRLVSTGLVAGVIGAAFVMSLAPTIAFRVANGPNNQAAVRSYSDIERYALKPVHMILPISFHRVELLREPMATAVTGVPGTEAGQNLGLVGAIGLVLLMGAGLSSLVGRAEQLSAQTRLLFLLASGMTLAAASGGFGASLGILGFTQIRAWNRIVVFIAFVVFAALGTWLTAWGSRRSQRAIWALAVVMLVLGVLDQTWSQSDSVARAREVEWNNDAAFVARIEDLLTTGAMVYQLPHMSYPENGPIGRMADYDLLKGYLHSEDLRWSYPAMRGRVPEWQPELLSQGLPGIVEGLAAVGFEGLYIDRFGYEDAADGLVAELAVLLAQEPMVSDNDRLVFFDLRPAVFELRSRLTPEEIDALAASVLLVDELPR
jgi:phosphoglycerol transferase